MPIHDGLGSVEFATAAAVMEYLETLGWNPTSIRNKPVKFARVGETDRGFYVEIFQSYAAAMAAEKSRAATVPTQERRAA